MSKNSYLVLKRLVDITVSMFALILLFPVFIIVAIIIKLQDSGTVIYKQERLGKNSRPFMIYKFRSMKSDAPVVAAKDMNFEKYTTRVGKFIRKTSIDELPQLLNILKGEMSFVGPRPLIPNEGEIIEKRKETGIDRMTPGLTGWAQIKDRQIVDHHEKLELELYYRDKQSLGLDIKIMWMTLFNLQGK